jgi:hypothetical protein
MRSSLTQFLPLVISLPFLSCSPAGKLGGTESEYPGDIQTFSPLGHFDGTLLYKTSIDLYNDHYSGLLLIKSIPADSSVRLVLLSEIGLSLMDMEYRDDRFRVVSVQDFLDRSSLLGMIQEDFRVLLLDLTRVHSFRVEEEDGGKSQVLCFKHNSNKYVYFRTCDTGTYRVDMKKGWFRKVEFEIGDGVNPGIRISHRGMKLQMEMNQLERAN